MSDRMGRLRGVGGAIVKDYLFSYRQRNRRGTSPRTVVAMRVAKAGTALWSGVKVVFSELPVLV
jgi:hypothetical protein